jgi:hypothetical protein
MIAAVDAVIKYMPTHFAAILDKHKIVLTGVWVIRFDVIGSVDCAVEV